MLVMRVQSSKYFHHLCKQFEAQRVVEAGLLLELWVLGKVRPRLVRYHQVLVQSRFRILVWIIYLGPKDPLPENYMRILTERVQK